MRDASRAGLSAAPMASRTATEATSSLLFHREGARSAFVEHHAVTSSLFGAVQRRVRGLQDQLGRGMSLRSLRDPDAERNVGPRGTRLLRVLRWSGLPCRPI